MTYRSLNPEFINKQLSRLSLRISERFPSSGLLKICRELEVVGDNTRERAEWLGQPIYYLRAGSWTLALLLALGVVATVFSLRIPGQELHFFDFIQLLEAGINDVVFIAAAIFFLITIEARIKRKRALAHVHELRSIVHIIDMHQLTKDPERLLDRGPTTESSPTQRMSAFELSRYLDYCSEMLSLSGKLAALYVQGFDDAVVLASVSELESLTTELSTKIWQKILIVHSFED
ncbi:MAG: hypothetical protein AB8G17_03995 [Gammaproteobacteria bacterium]